MVIPSPFYLSIFLTLSSGPWVILPVQRLESLVRHIGVDPGGREIRGAQQHLPPPTQISTAPHKAYYAARRSGRSSFWPAWRGLRAGDAGGMYPAPPLPGQKPTATRHGKGPVHHNTLIRISVLFSPRHRRGFFMVDEAPMKPTQARG